MRDRLNSNKCSKFLKALGDPERLRIIQCLQSGPRPVGEICKRVNSVLPNVSHHLKQLRIAGLIFGRKKKGPIRLLRTGPPAGTAARRHADHHIGFRLLPLGTHP